MRGGQLLGGLIRRFNEHGLWRHWALDVWGRKVRPPTFDRWLALALHRCSLMGRDDLAFLRAHVRSGMRVVDIGANQGLYTLLFSGLVGEMGQVWAFEPDDVLFAALEQNLAANDATNVRALHRALGAASGTMTLYRSLLNSGDNRLAAAGRDRAHVAVEVAVEPVENLLAGERVDFIKMDVQGWEMEVFRGMGQLLDDPRNMGLGIYFEYWPRGLRDAGSDPLAPLEFLAGRGFSIYQPTGGALGERVNDFAGLARPAKPNAYTNLYARRDPAD